MKTISDISVTPVDALHALAALAPVEKPESVVHKPAAGKPVPASTQGPPQPFQAPPDGSLGPMDVGKYLDHYGVSYEIKERLGSGHRTVYALAHCLFDMKHGKGEASIIQDGTGRITYHCFHQSCNHTWQEARSIISGEDKIARFCAGYDPGKAIKKRTPKPEPPESEKSPFDMERSAQVPAEPPGEGDDAAEVPEPDHVAPGWFFDGKRFMPAFLASYLEQYLSPLAFDGGDFYRYAPEGVWKKYDEESICQIAGRAMGRQAATAKIKDAVTLLSHRAFVPPQEFKHAPGYLNLKSGMLNLETLDIEPHDPKYNSRYQLPIRYDMTARADRWYQFLEEIFPGEEGRQKALCLQSFFGYCLLPDCRHQQCLFLIGGGANGKSVVIDILVELVGHENMSSLPLQLFGQRFLIGQLRDKMINVAGEISTQGMIDTDVFKNAVGGGILTADEKHGKPFTFIPHAKHIFAMNDVPKISDKSHGFARRPIILKFTEQFDGDRKDPNLTKKLKEELDGIFIWMLEGLNMVMHYGNLYVPGVVEDDGREFLATANPVLFFFEEMCELGDGKFVAPQKLYDTYLEWCDSGKQRPMSRNRFYSQLLLHFKSVKRSQIGPNRMRVFTGIGLQGVL